MSDDRPVGEIPDDELMAALGAATAIPDRFDAIVEEMGRRAKVSMGVPEDTPIVEAIIGQARKNGTLIEIEPPVRRPSAQEYISTRTDCKGQPLDTPTADAVCSHMGCSVAADRIDGRRIGGHIIRWTCGNHETDKGG